MGVPPDGVGLGRVALRILRPSSSSSLDSLSSRARYRPLVCHVWLSPSKRTSHELGSPLCTLPLTFFSTWLTWLWANVRATGVHATSSVASATPPARTSPPAGS